MSCEQYTLKVTTQGPTYPPSVVMDEDGNFVADETIKDKDDLISVVENNYGSMGAEVAKEEIFAIETGDHFS